MAYTGTSIVDYLKSVGQASDFTSRTALATQYGIQNYTGTAEQNTQLLNTLNKPSGGLTTTNAPLGSTQATNDLLASASKITGIPYQTFTNETLVPSNTIPTSTLQNQTKMEIPTATPTNASDVLAAGATTASDQYTKSLTESRDETESAYNKLSSEISSLLGTTVGRGAEQLNQEQLNKVPELKQQLTDVNNQIQTKLAEFNKIQAQYAEATQVQEGKTIPMNLIIHSHINLRYLKHIKQVDLLVNLF